MQNAFLVHICGKTCHVLEFYYLMEAPEGSSFAEETDTGEKLVWLPLDELDKYDVRPIMLKTKLKEAIEGGVVLHVINNDIDRTIE